MSKNPVGILLAAGSSQRFGSNKLLYPILNNTPMLLLSAKKLSEALPGSLVVINKNLTSYKPQLEQLGLEVVINAQAEKGMGASIACGVNHSQDAAGWLITLADMPYIKTATLSLLANKLKEGAGIVAPEYKQQRGHPVGFGASFKNDLLALNKDVGAREIIRHHHEQVQLIETDDLGVLQDIDHKDEIL